MWGSHRWAPLLQRLNWTDHWDLDLVHLCHWSIGTKQNAGKMLDSEENNRNRDTSVGANEWGEKRLHDGISSLPSASLHTKLQRKFAQLLWLGWLFKSSLFMCYLFVWINYLKFGALYKGSSLQIMTPLHSLPMGCVRNFLEYKSCIIHAYRRATSINYVSLLGARVFTTSSFFFFFDSSSPLSLPCSIATAWRGKKRKNPWLRYSLRSSVLLLSSRGSNGPCPTFN